MKLRSENLKLARLALQSDINISEEELRDALMTKLSPSPQDNQNNAQKLPRIIRRLELPKILGLSLREVDRLIHPTKKKNRIVAPAQIPSIKISKKAIGVLEEDLIKFINLRKNVEA